MMKRLIIATLMFGLACVSANAHELTPTYPTFGISGYDGVVKTTMTLFNRRDDVSYYSIEVYDAEWNPISFAADAQILKVDYLERKIFDIYIRKADIERVEYICTRSKLIKGEESSVIASNICSRIK